MGKYTVFLQTISDTSYEYEVEENCECGLTEAGLWDEALFDKWGCECNRDDKECDDG